MQQLNLVAQQFRDTEIIHISGVIDTGNFNQLSTLLGKQLQACRHGGATPQVILECGHLQHISSGTLKAILDFAHLARDLGGDIKCARLAPTIEQIVNLIANGDPLDCYPDVSYALDAFHGVTA